MLIIEGHLPYYFLCSVYLGLQYPVPCRILRSDLLSAAVIGVQPILIIEVGTHWEQVKGH